MIILEALFFFAWLVVVLLGSRELVSAMTPIAVLWLIVFNILERKIG